MRETVQGDDDPLQMTMGLSGVCGELWCRGTLLGCEISPGFLLRATASGPFLWHGLEVGTEGDGVSAKENSETQLLGQRRNGGRGSGRAMAP